MVTIEFMPKKEIKKPRIQRKLSCYASGNPLSVSADKFDRYFNFFGSTELAEKYMMSADAEKEMHEDPFQFFLLHHPDFKTLLDQLSVFINTYNKSGKTQDNILRFQADATRSLDQFKIVGYEFITTRNEILGVKFRFPLIGDYIWKPK